MLSRMQTGVRLDETQSVYQEAAIYRRVVGTGPNRLSKVNIMTGKSASAPSIAVWAPDSGACAPALKLKEAGFDKPLIFERRQRSEAPGATYFPGCCCDIQVALYQFSFAPSLDWSPLFSKAFRSAEILPRTSPTISASLPAPALERRNGIGGMDEAPRALENHHKFRASPTNPRYVAALGQLNRPVLPNVEGVRVFAGRRPFAAGITPCSSPASASRLSGPQPARCKSFPRSRKSETSHGLSAHRPTWVVPRLDRPPDYRRRESAHYTAPHVAMLNRDTALPKRGFFSLGGLLAGRRPAATLSRAWPSHLNSKFPMQRCGKN